MVPLGRQKEGHQPVTHKRDLQSQDNALFSADQDSGLVGSSCGQSRVVRSFVLLDNRWL